MPTPLRNAVRVIDGSTDFAGGIDSSKVPTIQSESNPHGLPRNQLAWGTNISVRSQGITHRSGWKKLTTIPSYAELYQGGFLYDADFANPHLIVSIGGRIIKINVDTDNSIVDLSLATGLYNPPNEPRGHFEQGEQFLIIQTGDLVTLPLFYDVTGAVTTLRRSNGLTGNITNPNISELPAAGPMDYFMGRLWYAGGREYTAGDIVNGPTGAAPYDFRDSILRVTENPLALLGDGFIVPTNAGNIRALEHAANLNTALGQGSLFVFTRSQIYQTNPPIDRKAWIAVTANTQPLQTVAQINFGAVSDRSIVTVNGDLFYQTLEPGVRSLTQAVRYFQQWGNTNISNNENRVLFFNNRELLNYATGIQFNNRMLQSVLPIQTPVGVAHQGVMPLDFNAISSLGENQIPPAWEGMLQGLDILQLFEGDFGGLQRAFAVAHSQITGEIELWELTLSDRFDDADKPTPLGDKRINWFFETPAYVFSDPFMLKDLETMELWVDQVFGTVQFQAYYRPDSESCYQFWHAWEICSARDCREDPNAITCPDYPITPYCPTYRATMRLPKPAVSCQVSNGRPMHRGYQFQVKLMVKGSCRIRGLLLHALPVDQEPFANITC